MQRYYQSLSEKDRRRYAAIEAVKLGYGGIHSTPVQMSSRNLGVGTSSETFLPNCQKGAK